MLTMDEVRTKWPHSHLLWLFERILWSTKGLTTPAEIHLQDYEMDKYLSFVVRVGAPDPVTPLIGSLGTLLACDDAEIADPVSTFKKKTKMNLTVEMGRNGIIHLVPI